MYRYLLWKDIQEYIIDNYKNRGRKLSFANAALELEDTKSYYAHMIQFPDFASWDCVNPDDLFSLYEQLPILPKEYSSHPAFTKSSSFHLFASDDFSFLPCPRMEAVTYTMDNFIIHYILKGDAHVTINNQSYDFHAGTLNIIAPEIPYCFFAEENCVAVSFLVWDKKFESIFFKLFKHENLLTDFFRNTLLQSSIHFFLPNNLNPFAIVREMFAEYYADSAYRYDICSSLFELLLFKALKSYSTNLQSYLDAKNNQNLLLPVILNYIQNNYQSLSLDLLAEIFHYNPDYLSKHLKKETGKSFMTLITEVRISVAKTLLLKTNSSIGQIGMEVGYSSLISFSRRFRQIVGLSPTQYREHVKTSKP